MAKQPVENLELQLESTVNYLNDLLERLSKNYIKRNPYIAISFDNNGRCLFMQTDEVQQKLQMEEKQLHYEFGKMKYQLDDLMKRME